MESITSFTIMISPHEITFSFRGLLHAIKLMVFLPSAAPAFKCFEISDAMTVNGAVVFAGAVCFVGANTPCAVTAASFSLWHIDSPYAKNTDSSEISSEVISPRSADPIRISSRFTTLYSVSYDALDGP